MGTGGREVQPFHGQSVAGVAQQRPPGEPLVQPRLQVQRVAAADTEVGLDVRRGQHLTGDDERADAGRGALQRLHHEISETFSLLVPAALTKRIGS